MSRSKIDDYSKIFNAIVNVLPHTSVECITTDFEKAEWGAIRKVFPNVDIQGCHFHFAQALERKIKKLGLSNIYSDQNCSLRTILRKCIALPFLPAHKIEQEFVELEKEAHASANAAMIEFVDYVRDTWFEDYWPCEQWCVYHKIVRTNNDLEGYHNKFNSSYGSNLSLYLLISGIYEECKAAVINAELIYGQLLDRNTRPKYTQLQENIITTWEKYDNGQISDRSLLYEMSLMCRS